LRYDFDWKFVYIYRPHFPLHNFSLLSFSDTVVSDCISGKWITQFFSPCITHFPIQFRCLACHTL
jgi:hypothetical protein